LKPLLSAVLPDILSDGTFEKVCKVLQKNDIVDGRWSCLKTDPKVGKRSEAVKFGFLKTIFDSILSALQPSRSLVKLTVAGSSTPMSQRTNQSRPDAYVHLEEKTFPDTKAVSWADIVMPMEFKKASNARASSDVSYYSLIFIGTGLILVLRTFQRSCGQYTTPCATILRGDSPLG
jgi:hypothetical protein